MTDFNAIKKQLANIYESTGVKSIIPPANLTKWENILAYQVKVLFSNKRIELETTYSMGLGHFEGNKHVLIPEDNCEARRLANEKWGCEYVSTLSPMQTAQYFIPSLIFASVCKEALDALDFTVEDYCREFFGNADSYKGHLAHALCLQNHHRLTLMIGRDLMQEFANLTNAL
jgi:hypothetical protein